MPSIQPFDAPVLASTIPSTVSLVRGNVQAGLPLSHRARQYLLDAGLVMCAEEKYSTNHSDLACTAGIGNSQTDVQPERRTIVTLACR